MAMYSYDVTNVLEQCAAAIFRAVTLNMEVACSSETLVSTYKVTVCHESDQDVNLQCHQSLKSYMTEDDILRTVIL
jgi:hypothetical protein